MSAQDLEKYVGRIVRQAVEDATRPMARVCAFCHSQSCVVHCVFCGADCELPVPDHRETCPAVTGVYPVDERGMSCCRCSAPLELVFHLVALDHDVFEVVCAECAFRDAA